MALPGKRTDRTRGGRWRVLAVALAAAPLAAAACSSGGTAATPGGTTITAVHTSHGTVIAGGKGLTVYLFEKDTGTKPSCYGACATAWPPVLTTGPPGAGGGVKASLLGTAKRSNGTTQVTYAGHPLYYFSGDHKPGDVHGSGAQAFGAGWDLLRPSGTKVG